MIIFRNIKEFCILYKTEIIIFFIASIFSFAAFHFNTIKFQNDDQFTIYRYVDNIASGKGFVFNEGEKVLGSTTPLFTLLGALLKVIFPSTSTQILIALLNVVLISLSAVVFFRLSTLLFVRSISLLSVCVFILNLSRVISAGMESPLFILAILLVLFYVFTTKQHFAAFWLGVALLTRPDAMIVAGLVGVYWLYKEGCKKTIQYTAVVAIVVLPWIIFSTLYFGSPVPQSLITKSHIGDIVYQSKLQAFKVQLAHVSRVFWGKVFDPNQIALQVVVNLAPVLFLFSLGFKKFKKEYWLLFGIPVVYFIIFSYSNPVMFAWYLYQIEPFWLLGIFCGCSVVYTHISESTLLKKKLYLFVCGAVLILGPLYGYAQSTVPKGDGSKITLYKLALYIKENKSVGDTVGLSNIGIVSHTLSDTYIYDFIGLTRRDTLQYYPIKDECLIKNQYVIPPQMVQDVQPDWIVAGDAEWVPCFVKGSWFTEKYENVYSIGEARVWHKVK